MTKKEFSRIRKMLKKTQKETAILMGISQKAVESYEQGLRNIPRNIERIMYFLLFKLNMDKLEQGELCWNEKGCSPEIRRNCVAWIAKEGFFCWFLTGKTCMGQKMVSVKYSQNCFDCNFFQEKLKKILS